ncbi:MAG: hypothetical protein ONB44_05730 [candidate division KSB1 bacterium]|nr:hypothetical protein [candidate division KSB1 bacterium]MDZ7301626.1 hypothetical protein [candidate division KSB1 bacterium]MDZ7310958.1 hypothetical protein [candidate division KSB1 bacterium]
METITYSQVQDLVKRLPPAKLPLAYNLLADLADKEAEPLSPQLSFMLLPLNERRRIMTQQANQLIAHYEQTANERQEWQSGDFIDEY